MGRRDEQDNFYAYMTQRDLKGRTPLILAILSSKKALEESKTTLKDENYHSKSSGHVVETLLNLGADP